MPESQRRVRPTPTDAYLANPHKGCCTFQHFNGDPLYEGASWSEEGPLRFPPAGPPHGSVYATDGSIRLPPPAWVDGYLPTTLAYCRWFWKVLEPEEGRYDFSMLDGALEACRACGQTLAVRLMAYGAPRQPQLPGWYARKYPVVTRKLKSEPQVVPDHDAPEYFQRWGGLIREFARRYDAHPLLECVDLAYFGPWGEGAGECSPEQCRRFAELWREAFARTPRMGLIGGAQMRAAVATGAGWRCDCFGDLRETTGTEVPRREGWNHMFDFYPREVCACGARDAWKTAPVHLETCAVPLTWQQRGYDLDFILEQGLKYHASAFMPKYTRLPEAWLDRLAIFCRKLGYRFCLRQALFDRCVRSGGVLRFQSWIENTGVAPLYHRYDFALRLRQGEREEVVVLAGVDARAWLPGDVWLDESISLPPGFRPGWVELAAGLVAPGTRAARISFAVREAFNDRWADLQGFEVV